ncbi:hypothetical protein F383_18242 [Gossypium arboreum]|uniref:NAC domain-containing protein n=2 Tax=Gossypium arboreum TaxID=29729 RepID=A0A0B0NJE7_GOSAR|nr:hypothetical protein F383_18242 [Gossypium arboreum]
MNKSNLGSVSSSDLIDAKLEEHQLCGSKHCPGCGHKLEGKPDWLGLPAGVKFDPTDQELIEHLEAKVEAKDMKSHPLIDEHFFHRPSKAYTTGTRKRRKIQTECDLQGGETRWHKTGKTRPVMVNGKQKGCKKILVLYTNFGKNRKPEKTNWVMHQYHLGQHEEEKEGELVVSKIFYQTQPRQCNWSDRTATAVEVSNANDPNSRRDSGSGSCSSKEVIPLRDEVTGAGVAAALSSYAAGAMDIQQLKSDHFSFTPFRKSFDEQQQQQLHQQQQQQQQQQQHYKLGGRSASGLEELIMGCTSSDIKEESSITNPQEAEWLKYSSFWPDPDNQDHHG